MRLHGVLHFCLDSRSSREKRSGRPWPKNDAMPGFISALMELVNLTNPHRGCALHRLYGSALLIAKSRRRILVVLREFVGFHKPHFPPNQCAPRWGEHPISKRSQACSRDCRRGREAARRTSVRFCYSGPRGRSPAADRQECLRVLRFDPNGARDDPCPSEDRDDAGFPSSFWTKTGYLRRWRCSNGEPQSHEHRRKPA